MHKVHVDTYILSDDSINYINAVATLGNVCRVAAKSRIHMSSIMSTASELMVAVQSMAVAIKHIV